MHDVQTTTKTEEQKIQIINKKSLLMIVLTSVMMTQPVWSAPSRIKYDERYSES